MPLNASKCNHLPLCFKGLNQLVHVADLPIIDIIPTTRPIFPTVNCQSSVVSSCCSHHTELSLQIYNHSRLYQSSVSIWRHFFSANPSPIYYYSSVFFNFIRLPGLWNRSSCYEPQQKFWLTLSSTTDIDNNSRPVTVCDFLLGL